MKHDMDVVDAGESHQPSLAAFTYSFLVKNSRFEERFSNVHFHFAFKDLWENAGSR